MNNQEYIESGILELYVAGALPESEMIAVTRKVNENPDIKAAVEKIEKAFIAYAALYVPGAPPPLPSTGNPSSDGSNGGSAAGSSFQWMCFGGWILFGALAVFSLFSYPNQQKTIGELETSQQNLTDSLNTLQIQYDGLLEQFNEMRLPNTQKIILASAGIIPDVEAIVFWNPETERVFVDASSLPEPPQGQVYQLWWMSSLDPLTPNDAGTLDAFAQNTYKVFEGKPTDRALAFAITLEPEGGSESPTLEALYVFGQVG